MKSRGKFAVAMALATWLGFVSAPACAQTTGPGPYYATPSWDQQLTASTRFIVLSNWVDSNFPAGGAAVLDRETGLVWDRSPSTTTFPWVSTIFDTAHTHCAARTVGNRLGWRLPTLQELASLLDRSVPSPGVKLPVGHPFQNIQPLGAYWSATLATTLSGVVGAPNLAWEVSFSIGSPGGSDKTHPLLVWCVRGGTAGDTQ